MVVHQLLMQKETNDFKDNPRMINRVRIYFIWLGADCSDWISERYSMQIL